MADQTGADLRDQEEAKARQVPYLDMLKQEFAALIDGLHLSAYQKRCLKGRWVDQVLWMEGKACASQAWHYRLRLTMVVGAAIVPALVGLNTFNERYTELANLAIFGVSLIVAICAAIEGLYHFGDRWRHYRRTVEMLKVEGWHYFQLTGRYRQAARGAPPEVAHAKAYATFADRVEGLIQSSVEGFIQAVSQEEAEEETRRTLEQLRLAQQEARQTVQALAGAKGEPASSPQEPAPTDGGSTDDPGGGGGEAPAKP